MDDKQVIAALATVVWAMQVLGDPTFAQIARDADTEGRLDVMRQRMARDVAKLYRAMARHVSDAPSE